MKNVKITIENKTTDVLIKDQETVLEAGLNQNLDLPFSCMTGSCQVCRAKVIEGEFQDSSDSLEKEEQEAGYILTCCSVLKSTTGSVKFED